MNLKVEISWASLWKVLAMAGAVLVAYRLREVVLAVLLSVFISTALAGVVSRLEKMRLPRMLATIMVFVFGLAVIAFLIYTVIPIALIELNSLLSNLNGTITKVLGSDASSKISRLVDPSLGNLAGVLLAGNAPLLDIIGLFLGGATYFFTVLVLSFYLTVSRNGVRDFLRAVLPASVENRIIGIYERTARKIGLWFHAQMVVSLIVAVMVSLGLWLMGVRYSLILGVFAAVFELVPVMGPIFSGALAVIIAAAQSWTLGLYAFILFLIIQQLESNVLVPLMMKRAIEIHPVVILISLLGGVKLAGFVGMLLAIPAAVIIVELLDEWSHSKAPKPDIIPTNNAK
ncbi:MAG: hypothetical protein A3B23_00900 [Candidatus Colwellbacteria bacterium RIFCSPLOWO2_01_FULL_48_10]|uniref:AI-2E family transporter n=1 Tax=Candidatus Colwellbacteria bacterium RIFCSPLOWO2_01_FULL_48_10 TaxID=1797690 RepID=A0A1G1Z4F6_9BACT|nr:MAG: hypothetical protein A3B23_00900 [Candidatus Colwellbacteria bacterium RIFCSPLOWO2_01_FULL_48_10]